MQSYSEIEPQPISSLENPPSSPFSIGAGMVSWLVSVALVIGIQVIVAIVYVVWQMFASGGMPTPENIMNKSFALVAVASTFVAHILTVVFCWLLISKKLKLPFLQTMGWKWHPRFGLVQSVILGFLMMGLAMLVSKVLPHHETEMEKMLRLGLSVRVSVALLAVFSAPFVEEFIYRGILYPAVESKWGWQAGIGITSLLFAIVHVPQYWGSAAAISTIMILSVVLTCVRAYSGSILTTVTTHFVYNGIQSVLLLFGLEDSTKEQAKEAVFIGLRWLGLS